MYVSGAQIKRRGLASLGSPKTSADEGLAITAGEARGGGLRAKLCKTVAVHSLKRRGLTTLGHCERPPTRVSRAERARPESVGVHSAQVSSG
ncbi:hypothetical protein TYRP_017776 [Tyrophagus putrescentiae]|nr:hypothetical protein TYRP_017776 [Tyrophagus putrescentiae]